MTRRLVVFRAHGHLGSAAATALPARDEAATRDTRTDVAAAFSRALGFPITLAATPREQSERAFRKLGFSEPAARACARMTAASIECVPPPRFERGEATLEAYVGRVCARLAAGQPSAF